MLILKRQVQTQPDFIPCIKTQIDWKQIQVVNSLQNQNNLEYFF
jgi:hypothetical protein